MKDKQNLTNIHKGKALGTRLKGYEMRVTDQV